MQTTFIERLILDLMRIHRRSLSDARDELVRELGPGSEPTIDSVVTAIRAEGRKNQLLEIPGGVEADSYRQAIQQDLRESAWYTGSRDGDRYWPALRDRLLASHMAEVVPEIDAASTKVVAHFADPGVRGLKKKGLVLGYVQSGKTANYTAVIAKAADAGYRMFIILSGMHNNLRRQTQARIDRDLGTKEHAWAALTDEDRDFGSVLNGASLMAKGVHSIAVVKKNGSRLRRLRDWLRDIDPDVRARSPILILDDEADQATPNSMAARDEVSRINALLREIWSEVKTGSYVGYTATPFANVFMDPDDERDLYPSDFILDLPRSADYFGAERIFGRTALDDADEPDDGLDMVRVVPEEQAQVLRPPSRRVDQLTFDPELPDSLCDAVRWFIVATAIRQARGQTEAHNSMLVHTSAYVTPHFRMRDRLTDLVSRIKGDIAAGSTEDLRKTYFDEAHRAAHLTAQDTPPWSEIEPHLQSVVSNLRVLVDNGSSEDRLNYDRTDHDGKKLAETVIAVGGSTLSRGLTLEGLTVSFFVRTSNTYDTLLQMGRWFGYRSGYEDLPRIWMPEDLRQDFMFLALVEEEMRRDMRRLEQMNVTPQEFGLRVRAHPGRLAITSRAKMAHAEMVRVSYAGQRHQTIVLHEGQPEVLRRNLAATAKLLQDCGSLGHTGVQEPSNTQFLGIPASRIIDFLTEFTFHPGQPGLRSDHIIGWMRAAVPDSRWNVVVKGPQRPLKRKDGSTVPLLTAELGLDYPVPMVNRAPLSSPEACTGEANIKALLSQRDWLADMEYEKGQEIASTGLNQRAYQNLRREHVGNDGLIIIYVVNPTSEPLRETQAGARRRMEASEPLVGLGLIFPESAQSGFEAGASYFSVRPDWTPTVDEEIDLPQDQEGYAEFDGAAVTGDGHGS